VLRDGVVQQIDTPQTLYRFFQKYSGGSQSMPPTADTPKGGSNA